MSHTPGPWMAVEDGIDSYLIQSEDYGGVARLHDPYAVEQGRLPQLGSNARLIAAAPDLLEALEALVGEHGDLHSPEAHDKAHAALRKARGAA